MSMKTYLKPRDVELIESQATCLRDRLLIRLLFHLGCRVSEALAIKMSNLDFEQMTITIVHLKTRSHLSCLECKARLARRHRFCPECGAEISESTRSEKKLRRQRVLPLDKDTLELARQYLSENHSVIGNDLAPVFAINRHRAWQIVRDCALRAGIPRLINPDTGKSRGVSPHRLRDAFSVYAMKLGDSGDGLRLLQEQVPKCQLRYVFNVSHFC
jgi:integrase/recombinase XerD